MLAGGGLWLAQPRPLNEEEIKALVQGVIHEIPPKPTASDAYERIRPSVVGVRASADEGGEDAMELSEEKANLQRGTGVVIVESGLILTNLHVVQGAKRVHVTFFDGTDAEAEMVGARPEHDLAVLQAKSLPDDLQPATMRSTNGLRPGEEVVAVGYPFGIGPSASSGVISGLRRDYVSPEGKRMLTNLIQFDAAVNPGNSGGPLVTLDGEVIGIVTGLLNPTEQRVFIGIGFAVPIENAASAIGLSPF
ncbi:MAG TPA: trypsin-like peptidase domain-containing protein [Burkholderiales bacterium]